MIDIRKEIKLRLDMILKLVEEQGVPTLMPVTDYVTAEDFRRCMCDDPMRNWSFEEWQEVNHAVCELLKNVYSLPVRLIPVRADSYFSWLGTRPNTEATRAEYAGVLAMREGEP